MGGKKHFSLDSNKNANKNQLNYTLYLSKWKGFKIWWHECCQGCGGLTCCWQKYKLIESF